MTVGRARPKTTNDGHPHGVRYRIDRYDRASSIACFPKGKERKPAGGASRRPRPVFFLEGQRTLEIAPTFRLFGVRFGFLRAGFSVVPFFAVGWRGGPLQHVLDTLTDEGRSHFFRLR